MIQNIVANISAPVRYDSMEGREYLVAPMVMLTEGVHAGSNGPLLYPKEELEKTPAVWNHKPVVVYHPTMNGQGISACDPNVITNRKVGVIMNAQFDKGKLRAEAWLEKDRANAVDDRIMKAIENNTVMELSTGLFTDNEAVEGEWNGKKYQAIARNYRPDHLALLPDKKGACSIEDGAGFLRLNELVLNEKSHEALRREIEKALGEKYEKNYFFILAVYEKKVVYELEDAPLTGNRVKMFVIGYKEESGKIVLDGEPEEVQKITEYRSLSGSFVGNFTPQKEEKNKEKDMKKEEMINALIANAKWEEADRPFLMNQDEKILEKMLPAEKTEEEKKADEENAKKLAKLEDMEKNEAKKKADEKKDNTQNQEVTADQYIANAPASIREILVDGLNAHQSEKNKMIEVIVANKKNVFTKEQLANKPLAELKGMAALATPEVETRSAVNYAGLGATQTVVNEEPLVVPVLNFGK